MKKSGRKILKGILTLMVIVGVVCLGVRALRNDSSRREHEEAMRIATGKGTVSDEESLLSREQTTGTVGDGEEAVLPDDPHIRWLLSLDMESLREINEEVIGWLYIPDTDISYPLLQGADNDFYLNHSWERTENFAGSIFLESQNDPNFCDFNTLIYGHNMIDDTMFGTLRNYRTPAYLEAHPSFYVLNQNGIFRYDIFAVNRAAVDAVTYGMKIETEKKREEFIRFSLDYSDIETDVIPRTEDKILTLATCSGVGYATRWVVQGVLNKEGSYIINDPYLMG